MKDEGRDVPPQTQNKNFPAISETAETRIKQSGLRLFIYFLCWYTFSMMVYFFRCFRYPGRSEEGAPISPIFTAEPHTTQVATLTPSISLSFSKLSKNLPLDILWIYFCDDIWNIIDILWWLLYLSLRRYSSKNNIYIILNIEERKYMSKISLYRGKKKNNFWISLSFPKGVKFALWLYACFTLLLVLVRHFIG